MQEQPQKDPFLKARQLLLSVGVSVRSIDNAPKDMPYDTLRVWRARREGELFLDALLTMLDKTAYDRSAQKVTKALDVLQTWQGRSLLWHRIFFGYRAYMTRNFLIDTEEALYFWTEELQKFLVWEAALFCVTEGIKGLDEDRDVIQQNSFALCLSHIQAVSNQGRAIKKQAEDAMIIYKALEKMQSAQETAAFLKNHHF